MFGMKTDHAISMEVPTGVIDADAMTAIARHINETALEPLGYVLYTSEIMETLGDDWIVTRGTFAGTFPKRLRNFIKKRYGVKITPEIMSEVGNIAKRSMDDGSNYTVIITRTLWDAGKFGDRGSCFFGGREDAPNAIFDANGFGITVYAEKESRAHFAEDDCDCSDCESLRAEGTQPLARCWVLPYKQMYVLFNCYSVNNGFHTVKMARTIATHFGLSYNEVRLTNRGTDSGLIWINGGNGYLVGRADDLNGFVSTRRDDLKLVDLDIDSPSAVCFDCDETLSENDSFTYENRIYCQSCHDAMFNYCENCSDGTTDDLTPIYTDSINDNAQYWCDDCRRNNAYYCNGCYVWITEPSLGTDSNTYCSDCWEANFSTCEVCYDTMDAGSQNCDDCQQEIDEREAMEQTELEVA